MTQDNLSLMRGGPVHRLLVRIGAVPHRFGTSRLVDAGRAGVAATADLYGVPGHVAVRPGDDPAAQRQRIARMSVVPVKRRLVAAMLLSAALPLVFFTMSFDELAKRLASILV